MDAQSSVGLASDGQGEVGDGTAAAIRARAAESHDPVNAPAHYCSHPSGIEAIQVTEWMGFNLGNAMKYLWRADLKNGVEDLEKAAWYVNREIEKRKGAAG